MQNEKINIAIVSLGCPKNLVDSEKMLANLADAGCVVNSDPEQADVILINTCGFLSAARDESLEVINQAIERKKAGTCKRVVVAGCLPSRDGEEIFELAPGVDAIIGVNNREDIATAVLGDDLFAALSNDVRPYDSLNTGDQGRFRLTSPHTAYLRIAEGCSRACAFCTIPKIRGPYRSKPIELIVAEAKELIASGAYELNIIAQDTTAYGADLSPKQNLAALVRALDEIPGARWFRLMYTYPNAFSDELIDALAEAENFVPYLDMPLQHISTSVLQRMKRGITREKTIGLLEKLRERIPGLAIRTSLITGFPGETEEEFDELLTFVEEFQFDALGVFEFSPEPGTTAYDMPDQISHQVAAERAGIIMQTQQEIVAEVNQSIVGAPIEVLVDGVDSEGMCIGRYYGQAPDIDGVCILTEPCEPGTIVPGTIVGAELYDLIVEPAEIIN